MIDPSLLLRPEAKFDGKPIDAFRNYDIDDTDPVKARVRKTYYDMHTNQTVDFVKGKKTYEKRIEYLFICNTSKKDKLKICKGEVRDGPQTASDTTRLAAAVNRSAVLLAVAVTSIPSAATSDMRLHNA